MACKVQRNDINDKGLKKTHPAKQIVYMGDLLTKEMTLASRTAYTPLQGPSKLNPAVSRGRISTKQKTSQPPIGTTLSRFL